MNRWATGSILSILLLLSGSVQANPKTPTRFVQSFEEYVRGQPLPHFVLKDGNGGLITPGSLKYGPSGTVLAFFQTTCPPCLAGLKVLSQSRKRFQEQGIELFLVHIREPRKDTADLQAILQPEDISLWLKKEGLEGFSVLYDQTGALKTSGIITPQGTTVLPMTVVIRGDKTISTIAREEGPDFVSGILKSLGKRP